MKNGPRAGIDRVLSALLYGLLYFFYRPSLFKPTSLKRHLTPKQKINKKGRLGNTSQKNTIISCEHAYTDLLVERPWHDLLADLLQQSAFTLKKTEES